MKYLAITILLLSFIACASAPRSASGVYRPDIYTQPGSYAASFPVNKASKQEVISFVGVPDKTYKDGDIEYLSYRLHERIEYTYYIKDGIVIDVKVVAPATWAPHR